MRPPSAAATVAALRALIRDLAFAPGEPTPPESVFAATDPKQLASALASWISAAGGASGASLAAALDAAFDRANARPTGAAGGERRAELGIARDLLRAALGIYAPRAAPPLRVLVEELGSAVIERVGGTAPPPLPAAGEEPGNVAAGLLRWLGAVSSSSGVPIGALRAAVEAALARTAAAFAGDDEAAPALARARDVLLATLAPPRAREPDPVPTYRPDLPVLAGARGARPRAAPRRPSARPGPEPREESDAAPGEDENSRAAAIPDLKGPMDLLRCYTEELLAALPGVSEKHFVFPACRWDGARWHGYPDATALSAYLEKVRAELGLRGVVRERALLIRVEPIAENVVIVHVRSARERATGEVVEEVETAVTAVRTEPLWRIAALLSSRTP